jgi:hypothetical protein
MIWTGVGMCIALAILIWPSIKAVSTYRHGRQLVDKYYAIALWICITYILICILIAILNRIVGLRLRSPFLILLKILDDTIMIAGIFYLLRWWLLKQKIQKNSKI